MSTEKEATDAVTNFRDPDNIIRIEKVIFHYFNNLDKFTRVSFNFLIFFI